MSGKGDFDTSQPMAHDPQVKEAARGLGCNASTAAIVIMILVLSLGAVLLAASGGDEKKKAADTATTTTTPAPSTSKPTATTTTKPPSTSGGTSGKFAPPTDVPEGSVLYQGSSGGPVGQIAIDGQFRYVSIERPGVAVGDAARSEVETVWTADGTITSFGVSTSASSQPGRYGFAVYLNGSEYNSGCTMEIGKVGCKASIRNPVPLHNGDRVVIIVGEAGNFEAHGDFTFDWWFVFKPTVT